MSSYIRKLYIHDKILCNFIFYDISLLFDWRTISYDSIVS